MIDVRNLEFLDSSFDVAIDKSMLHGSVWDHEDDVRANAKAYADEVA